MLIYLANSTQSTFFIFPSIKASDGYKTSKTELVTVYQPHQKSLLLIKNKQDGYERKY